MDDMVWLMVGLGFFLSSYGLLRLLGRLCAEG